MKRPSFQFYPADWRNNAKLRRCSEAARGAWMDIICVLNDSDEYGICRWPLTDLARAAGVPLKLAKELADKEVLKGDDQEIAAFTHTIRHAGQDGATVTLIVASTGPCWYSSRLVRDEWVRSRRGIGTRFEATNQPPKLSPTRRVGDRIGEPQGGLSGGALEAANPSPKPQPKPAPSRPVGERQGVKLGGESGDGPSSSSSSSSIKTIKLPASAGAGGVFSERQTRLTARFDAALGDGWENDRQKWMGRIKHETGKAERVIAEVESAAKEGRIKTTAARYAEQTWKEFK